MFGWITMYRYVLVLCYNDYCWTTGFCLWGFVWLTTLRNGFGRRHAWLMRSNKNCVRWRYTKKFGYFNTDNPNLGMFSLVRIIRPRLLEFAWLAVVHGNPPGELNHCILWFLSTFYIILFPPGSSMRCQIDNQKISWYHMISEVPVYIITWHSESETT